MFSRKKKAERATGEDLDREANAVANGVARERRKKISRRKWAIETAMLCADELTARERIGLAKAIDDYVYEGEAS